MRHIKRIAHACFRFKHLSFVNASLRLMSAVKEVCITTDMSESQAHTGVNLKDRIVKCLREYILQDSTFKSRNTNHSTTLVFRKKPLRSIKDLLNLYDIVYRCRHCLSLPRRKDCNS